MPTPGLEAYLTIPMAPPERSVLAAIDAGPIDPCEATPLPAIDTLLDPQARLTETGWCRLADGVGYVAVRTPMPGVSAAMVDWWFDWHAHESLRYRIWYPTAHESTSFRPPAVPGAKPFWGAVHSPVEDIGAWLLNRPSIRRRVIPSRLPFTLARHCAIEYAHLAAILPELYARYR